MRKFQEDQQLARLSAQRQRREKQAYLQQIEALVQV